MPERAAAKHARDRARGRARARAVRGGRLGAQAPPRSPLNPVASCTCRHTSIILSAASLSSRCTTPASIVSAAMRTTSDVVRSAMATTWRDAGTEGRR